MPELPAGKMCSIKSLLGDTHKEFNFSISTSILELMKGLSGVTSLDPYDGMLFDFGSAFSPIMTPKGLLFPVDVAFITHHGEIVEIHRLDPEYAFTQGTLRKDVQYALEVPVGFFDLHGLGIGDFLMDHYLTYSPHNNTLL